VIASARASAGFTLLELLVVIVIISILLTLASLSMRGDRRLDMMKEEARRLQALVNIAREEALLTRREIGLEQQGRHGYRFLVYQEKKWVAEPLLKSALKPRSFNEGIDFSLVAEGLKKSGKGDAASDKALPEVVFWSSGEVSDFKAEFKLDGGQIYEVEGNVLGETQLKSSGI
jgi:general secretion pathway protein H